MRKILLATTAIVGFLAAGAAQAATSPLNVTIGGSVDGVAGAFHESKAAAGDHQTNDSFETLYNLTFGVTGKSGSGVEYGANLSLNNNPDISNYLTGVNNGVNVTNANLFLSGAFGKVQLGDSHGATDLALLAPVVGEGQVYGRYIDFLDTTKFAKTFVAGVDVTDHSTNITYFTPKVGNETNKVQAALSFVPNFYNYGSNTVQYNSGTSTPGGLAGTTTANSPYSDVVKGAVAYTGTFTPATVGLSAQVINGRSKVSNTGTSNAKWIVEAPNGEVQDFTAYGFGAQVAAEGFTLGGSYLNEGRYNTVIAQDKNQEVYSAALKYEFSKVAIGVSYLGGEGYSNTLAADTTNTKANNSDFNYVRSFDSYGLGSSYAWAPGLTSNVDGVLFEQKTENGTKNDGYVLLVSQKLAF